MEDDDDSSLPEYKDVLRAAQTLKKHAHNTPVVTSTTLNDYLGQKLNGGKGGKIEVFLKCENFQKCGSFKFRGAFNAVNNLTPEQKKAGCLAYSAGNHGQGVALAGKILGIKTCIILPADAPEIKKTAIAGYGAEIMFFDRFKDNLDEMIANQINERKMTYISPFDHRDIIAGQGTSCLELFNEVGELDHFLTGVGGGGLISGCMLVCKTHAPNCKIIGVEPDAGHDAEMSMQQNKIVSVQNQNTLADGASTPHIGVLNLKMMRSSMDKLTHATDEQLIFWMKFLGERCKMIVEPTGVLGLAGLENMIQEGLI